MEVTSPITVIGQAFLTVITTFMKWRARGRLAAFMTWWTKGKSIASQLYRASAASKLLMKPAKMFFILTICQGENITCGDLVNFIRSAFPYPRVFPMQNTTNYLCLFKGQMGHRWFDTPVDNGAHLFRVCLRANAFEIRGQASDKNFGFLLSSCEVFRDFRSF